MLHYCQVATVDDDVVSTTTFHKLMDSNTHIMPHARNSRKVWKGVFVLEREARVEDEMKIATSPTTSKQERKEINILITYACR